MIKIPTLYWVYYIQLKFQRDMLAKSERSTEIP